MAALAPSAGPARFRGRNRAARSTCRWLGQPGEPPADLLGCGEDQVAQLVAGLGAGLDRAGPGHPQRPDRPPPPRRGSSAPRNASPLRAASAAATASAAPDLPRWGLPVRPHHLGHLHAAGGQVAGQPGAVAAGALHPPPWPARRARASRPARPGTRPPWPGRPGCPAPAHLIHRRGHVHVSMGVHAPGDGQHLLCDPGHDLSFRAIPAQPGEGGTTPPAGTGGQNTSRTPKVRLLPGHERPGRRLPRPAASPGPAVRRQDTRSAVSSAQGQDRDQRQDATSLREDCCGSPQDNPVDVPRPRTSRSNQS